jgi:raffinose/stachyose/melibiose transport system substrate-binding protein
LSVPSTFSQLLTLCKKITSAGKIPIAFSGGPTGLSVGISLAVAQMGNEIYGAQPKWNDLRNGNRTTFAGTPGWHTLLQHVVDMKDAGCFPPHPEGVSLNQLVTMLATNQAVMTVSNSALFNTVLAVAPNFPLRSFAFPGTTAKQTRVTVFEVPDYGVNIASQHKKEAIQFLDFLGRVKQVALFNKVANLFSPYDAKKGNIEAWAKPLAPYFAADKVVSEPTQFWPNFGLRNLTLVPDMTGLFTGQKTVPDILTDLEQELEGEWLNLKRVWLRSTRASIPRSGTSIGISTSRWTRRRTASVWASFPHCPTWRGPTEASAWPRSRRRWT